MTGPEHYRRAERLMDSITRRGQGQGPVVEGGHPEVIAAAQVHATLALAAATALGTAGPDSRDWADVAGPGQDRRPTRPALAALLEDPQALTRAHPRKPADPGTEH